MDSRRLTTQEERRRKSGNSEESEEGEKVGEDLSGDSLEVEIRPKPDKRKQHRRENVVGLKSIAAKFEPPKQRQEAATKIGKKTDLALNSTTVGRNIFFDAEDLDSNLRIKETLLVDEILRSRLKDDALTKSGRRRRTSSNELSRETSGNDTDRNRRAGLEPKSPR